MSYLGDTALTALRGERPDLVLCMTDPPIIGDVALVVARRFGVPLLVISQDVFPEIAERVKRLEQPILLGALRRLVALYLKRADRVVAIGETMKERLEDKGHVTRKLEGRQNVFTARVRREDLVARRLRETADELCDGSLTPLITHLVSSARLSPDELAELRRLVDQLTRKG